MNECIRRNGFPYIWIGVRRWEPKGHQFLDHTFPSLVTESIQKIATEVTLIMRGVTEFVRIGIHSQTLLPTGNLQRNR